MSIAWARVDWADLSEADRRRVLERPARRRDPAVAEIVRRIFAEVETGGAAAVARWSQSLDGAAPETLTLEARRVDQARAALDAADLSALELAVDNVRRYHQAIRPRDLTFEPKAGVRLTRTWRPIASCGLYIPGGTAPLFSTLLMLALPADVAGVPERVAVTPAGRGVHPMMIAAAAACGLERLELVGGAQAIAALTYGAGLPRVDKIFGPGNAYVAEAKRYAAELPGGPAMDLPAGPSELMVIADATADPVLVAADLLSQAEHDADAQVLLVAIGSGVLEAVAAELARQLPTLPRALIARESLAQARAIEAATPEAAAAIANAYAPEHLSLQVADADPLVAEIRAAGTVFVGRSAAETLGDYVSGPSHVLPTDGAGRTWSGVNVAAFMTSFAVQRFTPEAAAPLAEAAARLARLEGLEAHARAADLRARP